MGCKPARWSDAARAVWRSPTPVHRSQNVTSKTACPRPRVPLGGRFRQRGRARQPWRVGRAPHCAVERHFSQRFLTAMSWSTESTAPTAPSLRGPAPQRRVVAAAVADLVEDRLFSRSGAGDGLAVQSSMNGPARTASCPPASAANNSTSPPGKALRSRSPCWCCWSGCRARHQIGGTPQPIGVDPPPCIGRGLARLPVMLSENSEFRR